MVRASFDAIIASWAFDLQLRGCACSAEPVAAQWRLRGVVQWGLVANIVVSMSLLPFWHSLPAVVASTLFAAVVYGATFAYVRSLRRLRCACSEEWRGRLAGVWPLASFLLTVLSGVAYLYAKDRHAASL